MKWGEISIGTYAEMFVNGQLGELIEIVYRKGRNCGAIDRRVRLLNENPYAPFLHLLGMIVKVCYPEGSSAEEFKEYCEEYNHMGGAETIWKVFAFRYVARVDQGMYDDPEWESGIRSRSCKEMHLSELLRELEEENRQRWEVSAEYRMGAAINALKDVFEEWEEKPSFQEAVQKEQEKQRERKGINNCKPVREVLDLIENGIKQIILTGAPGTGKTYAAKAVAGYLGGVQDWKEDEKGKKYEFVQFHPSYDYTDFVEGLRPVELDGKMCFVRMDGIFKNFCRKAAEASGTGERYFFLIDEINRADLSKVFGELMYCLEKDKRGEENRVQTQYQNLKTYGVDPEKDVFSKGFYIPENVILLGTMNDIDRSVESMDFALRRRFEWIEVAVEEGLLTAAFENMKIGKFAGALAEDVLRLNKVLHGDEGKRFGLNRHYDISQGQFANLPDALAYGEDDTESGRECIRSYVWKYRIRFLLEEYLRGENEDEKKAFIDKCQRAFGADGEEG